MSETVDRVLEVGADSPEAAPYEAIKQELLEPGDHPLEAVSVRRLTRDDPSGIDLFLVVYRVQGRRKTFREASAQEREHDRENLWATLSELERNATKDNPVVAGLADAMDARKQHPAYLTRAESQDASIGFGADKGNSSEWLEKGRASA